MYTKTEKWLPMLFLLPALLYLIITTQAPFVMTVWYSLFRWNLAIPDSRPFIGLDNYRNLFTDSISLHALLNTIILMVSVIVITVILGAAVALLLNRNFWGRPILRTLFISSFLVMPVVTAVVWKNMLMNPVFGLFSWIYTQLGLAPVDWLSQYPMQSIVAMIVWEWTPFAALILLTGLQSLPQEEVEAARLDGCNAWQEFRYIVLPHWGRALEVVILLESIFMMQVFGEIYTATSGGPGMSTTNIPFFIYQKAFAEYNIGLASAAGVLAVVVTNIVASFILRLIGRSLGEAKA